MIVMGGGNRKKFNKSRSRRTSQSSSSRALFVQGGVLGDWSSPSFISHFSTGRNFSGEDGKGKSDTSRSRKGKGKQGSCPASGSGYASTSGGDHVKSKGNAFGYVYPCFNSQDNLFPNVDEDRRKDLESQPMILLDSKETPIVAYVDEVPNKNMPCTEYAYDHTAGFTLDESSHRGLRINNEAKETSACSGFSSEMEKKEGSSKASTPIEGLEQNTEGSDYVYGYIRDFTLDEGCHRGLGFHDETKDTLASFDVACKLENKSGFIESSPSSEDEVTAEDSAHSDTSTKAEDDFMGTTSSPERNPGFLCIAGHKIYTRDISDSESDKVEFLDEESSDYSETEDSSDPSDSGSDIDDVIAEDYFQGIGGREDFVNIDQLAGMVPTVLDEDSDSSDSFDKTVEKLGGIALQEASKEYGMMKLQPARKTHRGAHKVTPQTYDMLSATDDFMLMKDPRNVYGRKKHTKGTPQSWPVESRKSQKGRKIPGEKKKHRKEMIAVKRRERMIGRGVDLQHINSKLQQLVLDGGVILSFQPMHTRDCSQVQKLAAMYRLRSASQGSGKKKFVTVTRTPYTCMPSSADRVRVEKFIGADDEDGDFAVCDVRSAEGGKKTKKATRYTDSSIKNLRADLSKKKKSGKTTSYAAQPVSFVSSGVMGSDVVQARTIESSETRETCRDSGKGMPSSHAYGSFELHTTGFGSKMMVKMGYVEGRGLGKDGQGMAEPIEVLQRPKSLGLGADIPESITEASDKLDNKGRSLSVGGREHPSRTNGKDGKRKRRKESQQFAAFEKYTTGFGSRMMAKMGFVEGTGLGKDSQGMVTPLAAVRRPKSQGLGAKY